MTKEVREIQATPGWVDVEAWGTVLKPDKVSQEDQKAHEAMLAYAEQLRLG